MDDTGEDLTRREREAIGLAAEGLTTPALAKRMACGYQTARNHLENAYAKLGLTPTDGDHNPRIQAARWHWEQEHPAPVTAFELRREVI